MAKVILGLCGIVLLASAMSAQQAQTPAPAAGGRGQATAPPPVSWPSPPLPDGPLSIDTGLVRPIKITITKGLNQPWSMAFVPEGTSYAILVTERGGKLRIVRNGVLDSTPVAGLPADIQSAGLAGLTVRAGTTSGPISSEPGHAASARQPPRPRSRARRRARRG